ncbi:hypothetical protein Rsub_03361 [Raphidocelis subcapitata]|uniref:Uncharacterized protein n=1 Tax=Raphidocelis subcapitata TaxID=307507 RepID=A0A2V0NRD1_9CHLO|nr:hypothetical protein Rsub_03361 [Raphidocelis subcapitata]|eukprot:GBF90228.1 hypothetical protein Rsub_03361 [Raphidocelis subcapitata]
MKRGSRAFSVALALLAALALAAGAEADAQAIFPGGCRPCSSCGDAYCWQTCSPTCGGYVPITPSNVIVNGDACRAQGGALGPSAAASACQTARSMCQQQWGAGAGAPAVGAIGPTTLAQCANVALGACQQTASAWAGGCGGEFSGGFAGCDAWRFQSFFNTAQRASCTAYAQGITGVTPGTNNWAPGPGPFIIGGAAPGGGAGGGVGSAAPSNRRLLALRGRAAAAV